MLSRGRIQLQDTVKKEGYGVKYEVRKELSMRKISGAWGNVSKRCPPSAQISREKARLEVHAESPFCARAKF